MGTRSFLRGAAIGAGLVYLLDPERGPERRAHLTGRLGSTPGQSRRYGARLGDIDGLEAANLRRAPRPVDAARVARLAGGALAAYGLLRRGKVGGLWRTLGLGLATAGARPVAPSVPPPGERRRTVDIQQTLYVSAPPERVFAFWTNYDNFPLFLSNVQEVRDLGDRRSRWVMRAPDGATVEWDAVLTERQDNRLLAWRSERGAALDHAGAVRLGPEGPGTRMDLRFCYSPPAGQVGKYFGADPRATVNDHLGRLKALLESTVRSDSHGQESGS